MSMGVLVQQEQPVSPEQNREVPIPKKKWIKEYFNFGEKGLPDLPRNGSSAAISLPSSITGQNGHENQNHRLAIIPHGLRVHFIPDNEFRVPSLSPVPPVPELMNGFKVDHSYRRNQLSHSPTFDFGGTTRISKNSNSFNLNNRNSGTREVHNKLEKNRRAHLKECFELLKSQLPAFEDRKISNLAILRSSLRHIQALKRREREYEYEMERLAREKITLQQRLSTLKKDMVGKWDHLDWRAMIPEDADADYDNSSGPSTDTVFSENNMDSLMYRSSESEEPNSPSNVIDPVLKEEQIDDDDTDSADMEHPLSLTVNNCHIGEKATMKRLYGHVNGMNGISGNGPISLVTSTKLSSSPLAAIKIENMASSPTGESTSDYGGATCLNSTTTNSSKDLPPSMSNGRHLIAFSKVDVGQYYDEKMCK